MSADKIVGDCSVRITDGTDRFMAEINKMIRSNGGALALAAVVALVTGATLYVVVRTMWDSYKAYRSHQTFADKKDEKTMKAGAKAYDDDVRYPNGEGGIDPDLPDEPEVSAIARNLAAISAKYAGYNAAISSYLGKKGRSPDDVLDKRVLSARNDDFSYSDDPATCSKEKKKRDKVMVAAPWSAKGRSSGPGGVDGTAGSANHAVEDGGAYRLGTTM